jgi:hypothetical protein
MTILDNCKTTKKREDCSICGKPFDAEYFECPPHPIHYSGAKVDGKHVCYPCWGGVYSDRQPVIISYHMTSYVTNKTDRLVDTSTTIKELPLIVDNLMREPGYTVDWILIRRSCGDPDMGDRDSVGEQE